MLFIMDDLKKLKIVQRVAARLSNRYYDKDELTNIAWLQVLTLTDPRFIYTRSFYAIKDFFKNEKKNRNRNNTMPLIDETELSYFTEDKDQNPNIDNKEKINLLINSSNLDRIEKDIVYLRYYKGYKTNQIYKELKISRAMLFILLKNIKQKLILTNRRLKDEQATKEEV